MEDWELVMTRQLSTQMGGRRPRQESGMKQWLSVCSEGKLAAAGHTRYKDLLKWVTDIMVKAETKKHLFKTTR